MEAERERGGEWLVRRQEEWVNKMGRRDGDSHLSRQARAHCAVDKRWRFQTNSGWAAKKIKK